MFLVLRANLIRVNVMVNFIYQLHQATGYKDIGSNTILGVSVRRFWIRLTSESTD